MTAADLSSLAVEVLHYRAADKHPEWSVGSGYFVGSSLVLTAWHNIDGPGELFVRVHGTEVHPAVVCLQGDKDIVDLAVLKVSDVALDVPPFRYGMVDRSAPAVVEGCWAIGFPWFKERAHEPKPLRLSAQVNGEIPTGENLDQPLLTLRVKSSPRSLPSGSVNESEWEGISGAVVFSGNDIIVGVITEHHLPEGESALTIVPITVLDRLPEAREWWTLLGVDRQVFVHLPVDEREQRLRSQQSRRCDYYQYISPPAHYVSRQEVLDTVRSTLLADLSDSMASAPSSKPLALHGMGGTGKSIIARALCDDPEVQSVFVDGILWVTLGKEPELVPAMRQWIQVLGGTISENAPTVNSLKDLLAKLLKDRICLLIIDDVWQRSHAEAFCVGGAHCRMLLTTRDTEIVSELGAKVQPIHGMTEAEAITLLEDWSDGHLTETDVKLKGQIVKRLGYLPLAIKLAGAQLRRKQAGEWLQTFDFSKLKSSRPEGIHDNLELTFNLSLDALDKASRHLYVSLAIFKEDEAIPQVGIERLWQSLEDLDVESTADVLDDMAARALLEVTAYGSSRVVRLHDLLHDLIDIELDDERIGIHQALLGAYRAMCRGDGWHTVDDDGYLYDHLAYHLHAMGVMDELKGLFAHQHWLQRRVPQRDYTYDGYLNDLALAWKYADAGARRQIKAAQEPAILADCVRYVLIRTSINSIAGNYIPVLVAQAVEVGLWTPRRALSIAAKIPSDKERAGMYILLLGSASFSGEQREETQRLGLEAVLALSDKKEQAWTLRALAPRLTGVQLERAWEVALTLSDWRQREEIPAMVAPRLTGAQLERAWEAALSFSDVWLRVRILEALAPQLTGAQLERALKAALALSNGTPRARAMAALAPRLTEEERIKALEQGLEAALALSDEQERAQALAALAPQLTGEQRTTALVQGLEAALALPNERGRIWPLQALAPQLTGVLLERAWEAVLVQSDEIQRAETLKMLASRLTGAQLERGLEVVLALPDERRQAETLVMLAPQLSGVQLERGLEGVLALSDDRERAWVLKALAPQLTGELAERGLEAVLTLSDEQERAWALEALAPQLTGELAERGWEAALALSDDWQRAEALKALAPQLTDEQRIKALERGLEAVLALPSGRERVRTLKALVSPLTGALLEQGLEVVLAQPDEKCRAWPLQELAPRLTGTQVERGLETALALSDERERAWTLQALAPQLTGPLLERALDAALTLSSEQNRTWALEALAPQLTGELAERGWEAALTLPDRWRQAEILQRLAPQLTGPLLERALEATLALSDQSHWILPLHALAPQLTGGLFKRAWEAALVLSNESLRAATLAMLASQLTGEQRLKVLRRGLEAALALPNESLRAGMLKVLSPQLTGELLARGWEAVLALPDTWRGKEILQTLASQLTGAQLERALEATLALSDVWHLVEVLQILAPQLTGELVERGLEAALALSEEWSAEALAALAPQLKGEQHIKALERGLKAALAPSEDWDARSLRVLAPQLTGMLLEQALNATLALPDEEQRADALVALAPQLTGVLLERAWEGVLTLSDEWRRTKPLKALVPRLTGAQLERGLEAVLALPGGWQRAEVLTTFLPLVANQDELVAFIRQEILACLWTLQHSSRDSVLGYYFTKEIFTPPIFSPETLGAITSHIIEICEEWHWL